MQVQNIECQIAKAQLGRYLQGEKMDAEVVRQLEDHVATCPNCKEDLAEKRNSLIAALGQKEESTHPAPDSIFKTESSSAPSKSLIQALQRQQKASAEVKETAKEMPATAVAQVPVKSPVYWKPIAYSVCLAVVLIGMSIIGKGGANILGDRVAQVLPEGKAAVTESTTVAVQKPQTSTETLNLATAPTPKTTAAPVVPPKDTRPALHTPAPTLEAVPDPVPAAAVKPQVKPPVAKAPVVQTPKLISKPTAKIRRAVRRKPAIKRSAARTVAHRTIRKASTPKSRGIRVYDANGNPLH